MLAASTQTYNTPDYDHGVGSIISSDQYIHDFSCLTSTAVLKIHLTVKPNTHASIDSLHSDIIPVDFRAVAGTIILSQNNK